MRRLSEEYGGDELRAFEEQAITERATNLVHQLDAFHSGHLKEQFGPFVLAFEKRRGEVFVRDSDEYVASNFAEQVALELMFEVRRMVSEEFTAREMTKIMSLPETPMTLDELKALPEYSCSVPTGVEHGKRWRRNCQFGRDNPPEWMLGEYFANKAGCIIRWSWPIDERGNPYRGDL